MPSDEVRRVVEDCLRWRMVVNDGATVLRALDWADRHTSGFRDAMIVYTANQTAVEVLYSEGLSQGQVYGAAGVVNPLLARGFFLPRYFRNAPPLQQLPNRRVPRAFPLHPPSRCPTTTGRGPSGAPQDVAFR